jgi:hypothetical protein
VLVDSVGRGCGGIVVLFLEVVWLAAALFEAVPFGVPARVPGDEETNPGSYRILNVDEHFGVGLDALAGTGERA